MIEPKGSPFNLTDIFAYLASGFILITSVSGLLATYHGNDLSALFRNATLNETVIKIILLVFLSYFAGHVVAHFSFLLCQRLIVARILGTPLDHAMGTIDGKPLIVRLRKILCLLLAVPQYQRRLDKQVVELVSEHAPLSSRQADSTSHYPFRVAFTVVNEEMPKTSTRLEVFLALYSFCRNLSVTAFSVAILTIALANGQEIWLVVLGVVIGWTFLGRYLLFLKYYTDEVLIGYAAYVAVLRDTPRRSESTVRT